MDVVVGVTTAPRQTNYLLATVWSLGRSLRYAGLPPRIRVFAEPNSDVAGLDSADVTVVRNPWRLGNWHNWRTMCRVLLNCYRAPFVLTVEDDVVFAEEAVTEALSVIRALDKVGLVSLYTPAVFADRGPGVVPIVAESLLGACAWLWPRGVLRAVVESERARTWQGLRFPNKPLEAWEVVGVDTAVGWILRDLDLHAYHIIPSLVEHVGEVRSDGFPPKPLDDKRRAFAGQQNGVLHADTLGQDSTAGWQPDHSNRNHAQV